MDHSEVIPNPEFREAYQILQETTRLRKEQLRRMIQNRPQSWRYLLGLLAAFHFGILACRIPADLILHGRLSKLSRIAAVAVIIAIATRITWNALFANPYAFLGFSRPGAPYRCAVYIVSILTTIPALILHVVMLPVASNNRAPLSLEFGYAILQLVLLLLVISFYAWMVRRFLLSRNDQHYEPTVLRPLFEDEDTIFRAEQTGYVLPDLDPSIPSRPTPGHISKAYARQRRKIRRNARSVPDAVASTTTSEATHPVALNQPGNVPLSSDYPAQSHPPLRCQTVAWIDYMPESRVTDPLIPLVFIVWGTVIACLVYPLVQENSLSKLPSSKAKCGLYAPLGVYLLAAYTVKRPLRLSSLARIYTLPPHPWVLTTSLLGNPVFRNSEDGSTAVGDPRIRVAINDPNYIKEYNSTATLCEGYWGHLGRDSVANFRIRPAFYRFAFLCLAFFLFAKGALCNISYPTHTRDGQLRRPDLTAPDLERQNRIMQLSLRVLIATAPLCVLVMVYAPFCVFNLLGPWSKAILRYSPAVEATSGRQTSTQLP